MNEQNPAERTNHLSANTGVDSSGLVSESDTIVSKRKRYSAPALEKGLDILEFLTGETQGLNISQLAAKLGRSVGEIFRMIVVLEGRGYIQSHEGSDTYSVTLKLFEIANRVPRIERLNSAAAPVLKVLTHTIGQSCHVVIYYGGCGHVVVQQDAPSERIFSVRLGTKTSLMDTCSGHILLAFASEPERMRMIHEIPRGQRKPRSGELASLVERIRETGFEAIKSAQVHGVQDIGFPVYDHTGDIAAALVVPFLAYLDGSHPIKFQEAQLELARTAQTISNALGYAGQIPIPSAGTEAM